MNLPISQVTMLLGSFITFLAALGIVRMPDFFLRLQAITKATTLGIGLTLLGLIFHFNDLHIAPRIVLILFLVFLTTPVSAHMLSRVAYLSSVPKSLDTVIDELEGKYEADGMKLNGLED